MYVKSVFGSLQRMSMFRARSYRICEASKYKKGEGIYMVRKVRGNRESIEKIFSGERLKER